MVWDPANECLPRDTLRELQLQRLRNTVARAQACVPFYAEAFARAGVSAERIRTLDDLRRFPFIRKQDFRDAYPWGLLAVERTDLRELHASSGTTGAISLTGYTAHDVDMWSELVARTFGCAGARPGDLVHNAYGYGLFTGGLGAHYGAERLGATVVPMSGGSTERQIALIADFGARVLCSTPSYALAIAEVAERQGVDLRESALEVGLF